MTIPVSSGGGPTERPVKLPTPQTKFAVTATKPKASDVEAVAGGPFNTNAKGIKAGLHASGVYGNVRTFKETNPEEGTGLSGKITYTITVGEDGSVTDIAANADVSCPKLNQQISSLEIKKNRTPAENEKLAGLKKQKATLVQELVDEGAKGMWGLKFKPPGKGGLKINAPYKF
ncbi:hypothetical protein ACFL37_01570 [Candidatus Margulisiibacteriota bacterium]